MFIFSDKTKNNPFHKIHKPTLPLIYGMKHATFADLLERDQSRSKSESV